MKQSKRILAIALALVLGLALFAPGVSAADAPVITKQPMEKTTIQTGQTLRLEVEAKLPDGATGELSVVWHAYDWPYGIDTGPLATGAALAYKIPVAMLGGNTSRNYHFYAKITGTYVDQGGITRTVDMESKSTKVLILASFADGIRMAFTGGSTLRNILLFPLHIFDALVFIITYPFMSLIK